MKKLTTLFLCLMIAIGINAQEKTETKGVNFDHGTLAESLKKAKTNKKGPKMVFLDCYTSWCGPCKNMANNIFPMEAAGKFFNANFVNNKIDMEKGEGIEIAKKYKVNVYPTFLILDAEGNEINRVIGGSELEPFIERVKAAMNPENNPKAKKAAYDANKNLDNAAAYMEALQSSYMNDEMMSFFEEIFPTLSPEDRYSDKMWPFLSEAVLDPKSKITDLVLDEKYTANQFVTKEKLDGAICEGLKSYLFSVVCGRIKNADNATVLQKISHLNLLSNKDETAPYFAKVAKLYTDKNFDGIASLLDVKELMRLGESDRSMVERLITSTKELPKEKMTEYVKAKADYYKAQTEQWEGFYKKMTEKKAN